MKYHLAFIFGLILFITPFLGITTSLKMYIIEFMGILIMLLSLMRHYHRDSQLEENQTFSDSEDDYEEEEVNKEEVVDNESYEEEEKDDY